MNRRTILLTLAIPVLGAPLLLVLASHSPRRSTELRNSPAELAASPADVAAAPRAVVIEPEYNFGIMDPLQEASHAFAIRNDGAGPLELRLGSTTCKCTLSKISQRVIQPGESGEVVLTWNSGRKHPYYDHGATILTNDPTRPQLQLRVRGVVRVQLRAAPTEILLPRVEPDQPSAGSCLIYTQLKTPFQIVQVSCTLDGSQVSFQPATPAALAELEATSGYRVDVQLPAGLPQGQVQGMVQIAFQRDGEQTVETIEVPLIARVLRRLAIYGPAIDGTGTIDLGVVPQGQGAKQRLLMKVRDEEPLLSVREIVVQPSFVKVQITPYKTETTAAGLYHLDIELPPDAPECVYHGSQLGELRMGIDHPRIPDLTLKIRLAVKRPDS